MDGPPPFGPPQRQSSGVAAFHGSDEPRDATARSSPRDAIAVCATPRFSGAGAQRGANECFAWPDTHDTGVMVTRFTCLDSTVLSNIGKSCKMAVMRVQVGTTARPVEIRLLVDAGGWGTPDVRVSSGYDCLFPKRGSQGSRAKLRDDFAFSWPFRGPVEGLREPGIYEVWRSRLGEQPAWMPCTLMERREDGTYEVLAQVADGAGNSRDVEFHDVQEGDIRSQSTKAPLSVPERCLELVVPREDPLRATLGLSGTGEAGFFAHYLTHVDTAGGFGSGLQQVDLVFDAPRQEVLVRVAKNREWVFASVGRGAISRFVRSAPAAVRAEVDRRSRSWVVQLGPHVEHRISLERKNFGSRIFCLTIDGESFVEATAGDLRCSAGVWECQFRFVGRAYMNFEVYETSADDDALDQRATVAEGLTYVHECSVAIQDELNLDTAELLLNGVPFGELPLVEEFLHPEPKLSMNLNDFEAEFGMKVPKRVSADLLPEVSLGDAHDDGCHRKSQPRVRSHIPIFNAMLGCCVTADTNSTAELVISHVG